MDYSYEEIRQVVFDILSGRESGRHTEHIDQFNSLEIAVAKAFPARRGLHRNDPAVQQAQLSAESAEHFREVFWDLILQQIIVPGLNSANPNLPFFKVTSRGRRYLEQGETYFFHDALTYESRIKERIPDIDELTLTYLKEAMQAFRAGCVLSASVMLGVASEHEFRTLVENLEASPKWEGNFKKVFKERHILGKFNSFRKAIEPLRNKLPPDLHEDLDTTLSGVCLLFERTAMTPDIQRVKLSIGSSVSSSYSFLFRMRRSCMSLTIFSKHNFMRSHGHRAHSLMRGRFPSYFG